MNIIVIKGRLVRDPELKTTNSGTPVCTVTVAVDRSYSKDGEKQADFFDCVFWKAGAEFVSKYFHKGREILVNGEMQSRKYTDKDGNNRTAWEVQNCHAEFCGSKSDSSSQPAAEPTIVGTPADFALLEDSSEQLPF